jgi:prophage regulatory protein
MPVKILRRRAVEEQIGLGCSTIYALMAEDKFPKPIKIGRRAVGWLESDIVNWIENLQEQSNY